MVALRMVGTLLVVLFVSAHVSAQRPLPGGTRPSPIVSNEPPAPWANKLFLADIKKNPSQAAPRQLEYDFGVVPHGTVASQKFIITNIYDVPIQVIDVRRECGCLTAYPPQKVLQPNEEAEFIVTMNTGIFRDAGEIRKTLYVTFGPNFVSTAEIRFKATSRRDVTLTPGQIDFGIVAQGDKRATTAVVKYTGTRKDWKITGVVPSTSPLEVELKEAGRGFLTGAEYWVTVALKPNTPAGQLSETIVLKTNDPEVPTVNVTVLGQVQSVITVAPQRVDMKELRVGETVVHKVMLKAATPFQVQPLTDEAEGISIKPGLNSAAPLQIVEVTFTPRKPGTISKVLQLRTNLANGLSVPLPFEATVVTK